jgi:glycerophosphoryl diester phosphodiesterase
MIRLFLLLVLAGASAMAAEIVAHRGANKLAPENTRAAVQKCIELGVEWIEIDVRQSKDGVFYDLHDSAVTRMTTGRGVLELMNSDEIDKLDAGTKFSPAFAGEHIPRVRDLLLLMKGTKSKPYFDFKAGDIAQFTALVRELGMEKDCFFYFSDNKMFQEFRKIAPGAPFKMNVLTVEDVENAVRQWKPGIVECPLSSMTPEFMAACRRHNLKVMVWESKEDDAMLSKVMASPADMINTDHADTLVRMRAEQAGKK